MGFEKTAKNGENSKVTKTPQVTPQNDGSKALITNLLEFLENFNGIRENSKKPGKFEGHQNPSSDPSKRRELGAGHESTGIFGKFPTGFEKTPKNRENSKVTKTPQATPENEGSKALITNLLEFLENVQWDSRKLQKT